MMQGAGCLSSQAGPFASTWITSIRSAIEHPIGLLKGVDYHLKAMFSR
jgi:hypothetical protein